MFIALQLHPPELKLSGVSRSVQTLTWQLGLLSLMEQFKIIGTLVEGHLPIKDFDLVFTVLYILLRGANTL